VWTKHKIDYKKKTDCDKTQLITKGTLERKNISENEKQNKQQLAQERSEILEERIKNKMESDERKQEKKNEGLKNITEIGIWQNINEITSELALLKTIKEKKLALKKQINIHKETMTLHNEDKHLLQISSKGKQHDVQK
jgi:hypothetical protein